MGKDCTPITIGPVDVVITEATAGGGAYNTSPIYAVAAEYNCMDSHPQTTPPPSPPLAGEGKCKQLWPQLLSIFVAAEFVVYPAWCVGK